MTSRDELRALEVSVKDDIDDPEHVEISVTSAAYHYLDDTSLSDRDFHEAAIETAGILARLALHASGWIALGAQRHLCQRWAYKVGNIYDSPYSSGCHVGIVETILRPGSNLSETPCVWLTVPATERDDWVALLGDWLAVIGKDLDDMTAADQGEPSHDDTTTTTHDEHPSDPTAGPPTVRPDEPDSEEGSYPADWGTPPGEMFSDERRAWTRENLARMRREIDARDAT